MRPPAVNVNVPRPDTPGRDQRRSGHVHGRQAILAVILLGLTVSACRQDMHDQPRYKPLARNEFFPDHRAARPLIPGTVARGQLRDDAVFYTGKSRGELVASLPMPVSYELLKDGQLQFQTFCAPCHGRTGLGNGMVVQRGFQRKPQSYHIDRLRAVPVGYFFDVITNGFGAMSDYAAQVPVEDRWKIAAYIRALQLSQHATFADLPPEARGAFKAGKAQP